MKIVQYKLENLMDYELKIFQSGNCKSLAQISIVDEEIVWNAEGYVNMADFLHGFPNDAIAEGSRNLILILIKVIEAIKTANEFLITANSVSLEPEKIWFKHEEKEALLLPGHSTEEIQIRLMNLARRFPEYNGDIIAEKIAGQDNILRFLSTWALELKS